MTYAFIRHGQTDWNRDGRLQGSSDVPLNDTGRAQAVEAAHALADGRWDAIISSPLVRARETAEIIARELGIELGPSYPDLAERSYGEVEGADELECRRRYPDRDYPGAEPIEAVVERGRRALDAIAKDYPEGDVVIVCHGTIIRYTLADLAGQPIDRIRNGSVSRFGLEGERWTVLTVNGEPFAAVADTE